MKRVDALEGDLDLGFTGTYHPAGFRLNIASNSRDVLEAAAESWGCYGPEFECQPLEFHMVVRGQGVLAPPPVVHRKQHLFSIVSDECNFAIGDSRAWFGCFFLSEKTAADHAWLRWFFLESMAYVLLAQRYVAAMHVACVARDGGGILLCGPSGSGKSTLSFACARAGWTFVADDCTWLLVGSEDRIAIGKPHQARFRDSAPAIFPELAGYATTSHPNCKLTLEVPLSAFPQIRTALRCPIRALAFLDRRGGCRPCAEKLPPGEAVEELLREMPSYGPEIDALHERAVHSLDALPAWRLHFESLDDGLRLLSGLPQP